MHNTISSTIVCSIKYQVVCMDFMLSTSLFDLIVLEFGFLCRLLVNVRRLYLYVNSLNLRKNDDAGMSDLSLLSVFGSLLHFRLFAERINSSLLLMPCRHVLSSKLRIRSNNYLEAEFCTSSAC